MHSFPVTGRGFFSPKKCRWKGYLGSKKGIRDVGSTADFRILFEIFEILEILDFFETFEIFEI